MKYSRADQGRNFILRLEDGEILHEVIEDFARRKSICAASVMIIGGADKGSRLVVGPEHGEADDVSPMEHILTGVYEVTGTGTIFPDIEGRPTAHIHIACGRGDSAVAGCIRRGVKVWKVMEVIIQELTGTAARRLPEDSGFELLDPCPGDEKK
ncbi:MAG: PPC domain-containing DNA-binding protein [Halanaerobiaceae bacterium]